MKKSILILTVVGATLLMTSCLGENEAYYSDVSSLSYITQSELGETYARTSGHYLLPITSPQIKMQYPGDFVFITYSWTESQNTITEEGIYNAVTSDVSDPIEQTVLIPSDAPEVEPELPLKAFGQAFYGGAYFDYHWIYGYSYEEGDGNKKELRFYHNIEEGSENKVVIDVRLVNGAGTIDKDQIDILGAVNLKQLNDYYEADLSSGSRKDLKVHFRYYIEKADGIVELYETPQPYNITVVKE